MSDADPVTGLTSQDKKLIRDSWALVASSPNTMEKNGVELLIKLLSDYPYMVKYFPAFNGLSVSELRQDSRFRAHANRVMNAIQDEVDALDDSQTLVGLVQHLAKSHIKLGVLTQEFENLKKMFVPFLKAAVGSKCTDAVANSWTQLLTVQNAVITKTQEESKVIKNTQKDNE